MIKKIVHVGDENDEVLRQPAEKVSFAEGIRIANDLIDTATANNRSNEKTCCGLAANQIGEAKQVFVFYDDKKDAWYTAINPVVVAKSNSTFMSIEGCMSTDTETTVERHSSITIISQTRNKKFQKQIFTGFLAVEVQHELDHLKGILI